MAELGDRTAYTPANSGNTLSFPEFMPPSDVNDKLREFIGAVIRDYDYNSAKSVSLVGSTYTAAYDVAPSSYFDGMGFTVKLAAATPVNANFNAGIGAFPINVVRRDGTVRTLLANEFSAGMILRLAYSSSLSSFVVSGMSEPPAISAMVAVRFDDSVARTQVACTYSVAGNVITVTKASHGHLDGHRVYFTATTGGFAGQEVILTISSHTTNTFTASLTLANTSGAGSLGYVSLSHAINCHSVCAITAGTYYINYSISSSGADQYINCSVIDGSVNTTIRVIQPFSVNNNTSWAVNVADNVSGAISVANCRVVVSW